MTTVSLALFQLTRLVPRGFNPPSHISRGRDPPRLLEAAQAVGRCRTNQAIPSIPRI